MTETFKMSDTVVEDTDVRMEKDDTFDFTDSRIYTHAIVRQIQPGVLTPYTCFSKETITAAGVSEEAFGSKPLSFKVRELQYFIIGHVAYVMHCKVEKGTSEKKRTDAVKQLNLENQTCESNCVAQGLLTNVYPSRLLKREPYLHRKVSKDKYFHQEILYQPAFGSPEESQVKEEDLPQFLHNIYARRPLALEAIIRDSDLEPSTSEDETCPEEIERNENRMMRMKRFKALRCQQRLTRKEQRDESETYTQTEMRHQAFVNWKPAEPEKKKRGRPPKPKPSVKTSSQLYRPDLGNTFPEDSQDGKEEKGARPRKVSYRF